MKIISGLAVATVLAGCGGRGLESRITKLEGRVATLEGGGTTATNTITPTNTNTSATPAPEVKPDGPLPAFKFNEESHDFGTIKEGDVVEHVFTFVNDGEAPLIISQATGSCGCTVPEWSREPIAIGGSGEIKVKFNSSNKPGIQNKTVTVTANTYPKTKRLTIKANVVKEAKE